MLSSAGVTMGCFSCEGLELTVKDCAVLGRWRTDCGLFTPGSIKFESLFKSGKPLERLSKQHSLRGLVAFVFRTGSSKLGNVTDFCNAVFDVVGSNNWPSVFDIILPGFVYCTTRRPQRVTDICVLFVVVLNIVERSMVRSCDVIKIGLYWTEVARSLISKKLCCYKSEVRFVTLYVTMSD